MKRKKLVPILAFLFLSFSLSACGKQQPVEASAEAEIEVEAEESEVEEEEEEEEEISETSYYTGYSHYIDPDEEARKTAEAEAEKEEEEEGEAADQVDLAEDAASVTQEETKVAEQTTTSTETTQTTTTQTTTPETTPAPTQPVYTDTIPATITMDPSFQRCSMYVVYDTQVKDAPYAASGDQGLISRGSNIGVMERCIETGYYRVNYGAKAAYLPPDALSMEDPFK